MNMEEQSAMYDFIPFGHLFMLFLLKQSLDIGKVLHTNIKLDLLCSSDTFQQFTGELND